MKMRLLCGVVLPAFVAAPVMVGECNAQAQSTTPADFNWTGFYAGLFAGGNATHFDSSTSTECTAPGPAFILGYFEFNCADIAGVDAAGTGSMSDIGFMGGAQAGYNLQLGSMVVGIEADFGAFGAEASRTSTVTVSSGYQATVSNSVDADWLFTARGRLGWAFGDSFLAYGTGGLAFTHVNSENSYADNNPNFPFLGAGSWSDAGIEVGWTVGAGAEWALSQRWSANVEYLHVQFDAIDSSGLVESTVTAGYASAISTSTDLSAETARAGINYRF
jgi:outer membrane immunogenic protein